MTKQPRRRRLEVEEVGDVTVINFVDRKILDEQNIQIIGEQLFALVKELGKTRIVLNFGNVDYFSSAACGKLLTLQKMVSSARGKLVFCGVGPEIYEVFEIQKTDFFHTIIRTEQEALAAFRERWLQTFCPAFGCSVPVRASAAIAFRAPRFTALWSPTCRSCGAGLVLELSKEPGGEGAPAAVRRVTLPTYDGEKIVLLDEPRGRSWDQVLGGMFQLDLPSGGVFWLRVAGRLDLFAAEVLARAWRTVPVPRRIVVDLRQTTELTEPGLAALRALLSEPNEGSCGSVLLDPAKPEQEAAFRGDPVAHTSPAAAEASIDNVPAEEQRSITVTVRPDERTC
jgi:anti-sigma B factor antagonist